MPDQTLRTFVALELEKPVKEKIYSLQQSLKQSNTIKGSWVAKENLHLTIKFLGDTPQSQIVPISEALQKACGTLSAVTTTINAIGIFPNDRLPRVVWAGIEEKATVLTDLANTIEGAIFELGFEKEKREFKSHITICRVKKLLNRPQFIATYQEINNSFSPISCMFDTLTFFQSTLTPTGAQHTPLASIKLPQ